jgi:hypothetical protein
VKARGHFPTEQAAIKCLYLRSFELFRRNLHEPEVITFDELVARAEWHVETAAQRSASGASTPQESDGPWATEEDRQTVPIDEPPF